MANLKYGFIGAGAMAVGHLGCIEAIDGIEVVAASDPSDESIGKFKEKNNNKETKYYTDHRDLLNKEDLDAVIICAPDFLHVDLTIDALEAGRHVLCEKAAATSREDLAKLEEAVDKANSFYQVGLECRCMPVFREMKNLCKSGNIGTPRMMWCKEFRRPFFEKVGNWMQFQDKTGGVFVTKTCHFFDLMTWFSGSKPVSVNACAGQDIVKDIYGVKPDIFDNGWVIINYENGARACLGLCMFDYDCDDLEMGVLGDKGRIEAMLQQYKLKWVEYALDPEKPNLPSEINGNIRHEIIAKPPEAIEKLSHVGGVYYEHLDFKHNIETGTIPAAGIEAAKYSTLVGIAAEESARQGGAPVAI